jgi:NAD(P)-dependent dehydrogenase (short-subunit alcohol dehydrogenase family)
MNAAAPLPAGLNESDVQACLRILDALARQPELCDTDQRLAIVREHAGRFLRASRKLSQREERGRDRDLLDTCTVIRAGDDEPRGIIPALRASRSCYVCHQSFTEVHFFYDSLCPACAELNHRKRNQSADLTGRVALITGGRVKIGRQVALTLLRWGARVFVTTRFPRDAARRFAAESDFASWADRLRIFALDLRALLDVERFAAELCRRLDRLDLLVNNAAQTVRRPPAWYRDLVEAETAPALPNGAETLLAPPISDRLVASWSQTPLLSDDLSHSATLFPAAQTDSFDLPVDLRERTSWHLELSEVELPELVEVHAVNCLAPFVLLRNLDPLWDKTSAAQKYIVHVSSMEGNFSADTGKTGRHPHTNMAKAAMNMITCTCAGLYAKRRIWMNSVDPGWVSNEAPQPRAEQMAREGFREPLDLLDAAARILDPVCLAETGHSPESGKLFKDYRVVPW